ncbi:MAG: flagellar motor switch protein FliN [Chromatiales bacterium]|nr:flagellar motor switch protein FliN [Gammaproteobacteria bacterium]MCP5352795.1 flagellar motor switch protein FliN [Chromatiales bacterium]
MSEFDIPTTDSPSLDDLPTTPSPAAPKARAEFKSNPSAPDSGDLLGGAIARNKGNGKDLHQDIQEAHIEVIMDVPVTLSLEIGRTRITIRDLLQLNPGSVVKLERMAGEPMDIMVNGTLVAKGEVVTVGEKFGVRIAEVVSPEERIRSLR